MSVKAKAIVGLDVHAAQTISDLLGIVVKSGDDTEFVLLKAGVGDQG